MDVAAGAGSVNDMLKQYETEPLKLLIVMISFAGFGAIVKWFRTPKGIRTVTALCCSIATSAFVGAQVYLILKVLNLSTEAQFAITGACGYCGGVILDVLLPAALKSVKTIIEAVPKLFVRWLYKRLGIEYEEERPLAFQPSLEEEGSNAHSSTERNDKS